MLTDFLFAFGFFFLGFAALIGMIVLIYKTAMRITRRFWRDSEKAENWAFTVVILSIVSLICAVQYVADKAG